MPTESRILPSPYWKLLLLLPFAGLGYPALYARVAPTLFGFPFFYWYQFAWVVVASLIMFLVYKKSKRH